MKLEIPSALRGATVSAIVFACTAIGCGPARVETVEVSGKITQEGEPLPGGSITFMSKDGSVAPGGGTIKDGAFTAITPPGEKWVVVMATKVVGQKPMYGNEGPMTDITELVTSPIYNEHNQTPLETKIDGPTDGLNFDLEKTPKPRG